MSMNSSNYEDKKYVGFKRENGSSTLIPLENDKEYLVSYNSNGPKFEPLDIVAAALASAMMLGPLIAATMGQG